VPLSTFARPRPPFSRPYGCCATTSRAPPRGAAATVDPPALPGDQLLATGALLPCTPSYRTSSKGHVSWTSRTMQDGGVRSVGRGRAGHPMCEEGGVGLGGYGEEGVRCSTWSMVQRFGCPPGPLPHEEGAA
jgi:hypothetical protein